MQERQHLGTIWAQSAKGRRRTGAPSTALSRCATTMPRAGFEPARDCSQGILSPLCLPIPPPGQERQLPDSHSLTCQLLQPVAIRFHASSLHVVRITYHRARCRRGHFACGLADRADGWADGSEDAGHGGRYTARSKGWHVPWASGTPRAGSLVPHFRLQLLEPILHQDEAPGVAGLVICPHCESSH